MPAGWAAVLTPSPVRVKPASPAVRAPSSCPAPRGPVAPNTRRLEAAPLGAALRTGRVPLVLPVSRSAVVDTGVDSDFDPLPGPQPITVMRGAHVVGSGWGSSSFPLVL